MKKFLAVLFSVIMLVPALSFAQTATPTPAPTPKVSAISRFFHKLSGKISGSIKKGVNASTTAASLTTVSGTVASISGESISLTVSAGTDTVDVTNAKIVRKYGAAMAITDIATGDMLSVRGTVSGDSIAATTIRDNSQQQKNGTFSGTVSSVNGSSFVLATKNRSNQTINTDSTTVFKESGQTSVSISNITTGENVTVTGLWDSTSSTVAASKVTIVVKTGSVNGVFQSYSGNIIIMTGKNATSTVYSVDATNAKLVRRYGAAMQFTDYQAGDLLAVSGTINGLNITAKTVRDESLQAYNGTFFGTITAVNGSSFTLQSKARGSQTINTTTATVFRLGTASTSISSLATGETATVSGVWDRTESNVTANKVTIKVSTMSITGTLQSISGDILTVAATGTTPTTYTVDATNARVSYEHGYKGSLSILQTGDTLQISGKATSGSTNITATTVRDNSQVYHKPVATPMPTPVPTATPTPTPS